MKQQTDKKLPDTKKNKETKNRLSNINYNEITDKETQNNRQMEKKNQTNKC